MTIYDLRVARTKTLQRMRELNDKADAEKRDLSAEEQAQWNAMDAEIDKLGAEVEEREAKGEGRQQGFLDGDMRPEGGRAEGGRATGSEWRTLDGGTVRSALPGQALPGTAESNVSIGSLIAAMIEPRQRELLGKEERDLLTSGVGSSGGLLLPQPVSANLLQTARDSMVLARNATFIAMPSGRVDLVGVDTDPVSTFKGETQALDEGSATFRGISLDAKKCGVYIRLSKKLARSSNAAQVIEGALRASLASAIDTAILYGASGVEITGIAGTTGVQATDKLGGGVVADDFVDMHTTLANQNPPSLNYAVVLSTALQGYLWKLKDGEGNYLLGNKPGGRPANFDMLTFRPTNVVTSTSGSRDAFFLPEDGRGILIGYLGETEILISETAANTTNSAFAAGEVWIRILAFLDVALSRPAWFGKIVNIL